MVFFLFLLQFVSFFSYSSTKGQLAFLQGKKIPQLNGVGVQSQVQISYYTLNSVHVETTNKFHQDILFAIFFQSVDIDTLNCVLFVNPIFSSVLAYFIYSFLFFAGRRNFIPGFLVLFDQASSQNSSPGKLMSFLQILSVGDL